MREDCISRHDLTDGLSVIRGDGVDDGEGGTQAVGPGDVVLLSLVILRNRQDAVVTLHLAVELLDVGNSLTEEQSAALLECGNAQDLLACGRHVGSIVLVNDLASHIQHVQCLLGAGCVAEVQSRTVNGLVVDDVTETGAQEDGVTVLPVGHEAISVQLVEALRSGAVAGNTLDDLVEVIQSPLVVTDGLIGVGNGGLVLLVHVLVEDDDVGQQVIDVVYRTAHEVHATLQKEVSGTCIPPRLVEVNTERDPVSEECIGCIVGSSAVKGGVDELEVTRGGHCLHAYLLVEVLYLNGVDLQVAKLLQCLVTGIDGVVDDLSGTALGVNHLVEAFDLILAFAAADDAEFLALVVDGAKCIEGFLQILGVLVFGFYSGFSRSRLLGLFFLFLRRAGNERAQQHQGSQQQRKQLNCSGFHMFLLVDYFAARASRLIGGRARCVVSAQDCCLGNIHNAQRHFSYLTL